MRRKCGKCGAAIDFGQYCRTCLATPVGQPVRRCVGVFQIIGVVITALAWAGTIAAGGAAILVLWAGFKTAKTAPQEAVVCALACAIVIIPYCMSRALRELIKILTD